ncbi:MAG: hypothetical protein FWE35_11845 [Streptosporangiales bacterium]|nr:hypothetical protein [Streptosporangiales bacterium]
MEQSTLYSLGHWPADSELEKVARVTSESKAGVDITGEDVSAYLKGGRVRAW